MHKAEPYATHYVSKVPELTAISYTALVKLKGNANYGGIRLRLVHPSEARTQPAESLPQLPPRLLLAEGAHWIETGGAAGRDVAGGGRDQQ
jgi:hypothetical protein